MKILQVNKFYFDRGGAERYYFGLTDLLRLHGHEVIPFSCLYPTSKETPWRNYFVSPIETERLRFGWQGLRTASRFFWSREAARKLDQLLHKTHIDVAHLHNIYHQLSPSILSVLRRHRVPTVMTLHDFHLVSPAYNLTGHGGRCAHARGGKWWETVRHRCVRDSLVASLLCAGELMIHRSLGFYERGIQLFIAPSHFMQETITAWGFRPREMVVIPNFTDVPKVIEHQVGEYVLFSGRLSREKGIAQFFEVARQCPDVPFLIVGDGPLRSDVEAQVKELNNVQYAGFVEPSVMPSFIARALAVIIPSVAPEVFPMAALEAQAAGKAVAAFAVGGIPEIVTDGEHGLLAPEGDVSALAKAVQRLIHDRPMARSMGSEAYARAVRDFSADAHYHTIMDVYQRVIDHNVTP